MVSKMILLQKWRFKTLETMIETLLVILHCLILIVIHNLLNIQNTDDSYCFIWCVLAHLYTLDTNKEELT